MSYAGKALLSSALEAGELPNVILGREPYRFQTSPHAPGEMKPTDWSRMLEEGLYPLYRESPSQDLVGEFQQALVKAAQDPEGLFCSFKCFFCQLVAERFGKSPFLIDRRHLVPFYAQALQTNERELRNLQIWDGAHQSEGLWGEVQRIVAILKSDLGVQVL